MAGFADSIFTAFAELRDRHSFIPARAFSSKRFASLFKKLSDEVFLYIFVYDERPSNADLKVTMWIAPPDEPGDGLDNLYVGFKFTIASKFEVDDAFLRSCQQRIQKLLPYTNGLHDLVLSEMQSPSFSTRRYEVYLLERSAFGASLQSRRAQPAIDSFAELAVAKRISFDALAKSAEAIARQLIEDGDLSCEASNFYRGDAAFLGSSLVGHLYLHVLTR